MKLFFLFSVKSFIVLCFTHKSIFRFWVNFCVRYEIKIEIHFFCASKSSCSNVIYWKDYCLSIELPLHFYQKSFGCIGVVLLLDSILNWSMCVSLHQIPHCLDFCKFKVKFIVLKSGTVITLTLFFSKLF